MSTLSARGGHGGLAPELGLDGIPARSLVEFEGGGSMLSRDVLGEMLAVNERGVLNIGGEMQKRRAGMRRKVDAVARWSRGRDAGGTAEDNNNSNKRTRLLCQADALAWLRESAHANVRTAADRTVRKGGGIHGSNIRRRRSQQSTSSLNGRWSRNGIDEDATAKDWSSTDAAVFCSPKGRMRPLAKLYDHDHNPRVLRSLVDDTVVTGIAGGGVLKAEEGKQMDELRLQLCLVCHRATELEDQIFRSQTGAPHRELLGELQLGREERDAAVPHLNGEAQSVSTITRRPEAMTVVSNKRCVLPDNRCRPQKHQCHWSSSSSKRQEEELTDKASPATTRFLTSPGIQHHHTTTTPERPNRNAPYFTPSRYRRGVGGVDGGGRPSDSVSGTQEKQHRHNLAKHRPRTKQFLSEIVNTCKPPLSPPHTPTSSLRRYLSSLRPFSADSARASWGLADAASGDFVAPSDPRRHHRDVANRSPRWPVLFVMGNVRPSDRHPLSVYSLPLFDDDMLTRLADASSEPLEKIRTMTQVLSQFDFRCLQAAMRRLCCDANATRDADRVCVRGGDGGGGLGTERGGGPPGPITEAWVRRAGEHQISPTGDDLRGAWDEEQQGHSAPVVLSEAAATRTLTGGFLSGVFGDSEVREIVVASRPLVVFDSTAAGAGVSLAVEREVEYNRKDEDHDKLDDTDIDTSPGRNKEEAARKHGASSVEEGGNSIAMTSEVVSHQLLRLLPSPPQPSRGNEEPPTGGSAGGSRCHRQDSKDGNSTTRREDHPPGRGVSSKEEGVALVETLVRTASVRFRVHSVAARHRDGDVSSSVSSSLRSSRNLDFSRGLIGSTVGDGAHGVAGAGLRRRPVSASSDELGLPPLKLPKRSRKNRESSRAPWSGGDESARSAEESTGEEEEEQQQQQIGTFGSLRPRSTPRCLRPGFKGEVTAAMLRSELQASENSAARLGISIARKAEAWKNEAQADGAPAAAAAAAAVAQHNQAALALASTRARNALLEAANERMNKAVTLMYLGVVRRSWNAWLDLTRCRRSLEISRRVTRLVGAAALGWGVLEPLLRRRKRAWLGRWAAAMRAERVLEVQASAIELQRTARGFLGRSRAWGKRCNLAAVVVQSIVRGRAGRTRSARRSRFLHELEAVRAIERKYLELVWRRDAVKLKELRRWERAVTKVQATWRGLVCGRRPAKARAERRRKLLSAVMVQRLWRGVVAREKAEILLEAKNRKEAATRIQAVVRGRRARNIYFPIILRERSAAMLCRFWRCASARSRARRKRQMLSLALLVNPVVRGFLGRVVTRRTHEEHYRKQQAILVACIAAQKLFRGNKGRLKARRHLLRQCAAVELQRIARGRIVRRVPNVEEERLRSQLSAWMSAVAVQRIWRGLKGRKLGQREAERRRWAAAFMIQSAYRRFCMRRTRRESRRSRAESAAKADASAMEQAQQQQQQQQQGEGGGGEGISRRGGERGRRGLSSDEATTGKSNGNKRNSSSVGVQAGGGGGSGGPMSTTEGDIRVGIIDDGRGTRSRDGADIKASASAVLQDGIETGHDDGNAKSPTNTSLVIPKLSMPIVSDDGVPLEDPFYEDVGDVALAAILSARRPARPPQPPLAEAQPALPVSQEVLPLVQHLPAPPASEASLEYYEAKLRYYAAQEAAHGHSAAKIQAMYRAFAARRKVREARAQRDERERERLERVRAAVVVQSRARRWAAQRVVVKKRAAIADAGRRERGRLTIQCAMRCFISKRRLKHLRDEDNARKARIYRMTARIQARARGIQTREIWRKFFKSRTLLDRERQRKGAQQIQSTWRSKLARTEAERRKSLRDASLLAEQLERYLKSVLDPAMEAERKHAYAVRLQCWWRGILAVRLKKRNRLALKETPLAVVQEEEEKAALLAQCHWRGYKARRFYNENYASLFRQRERKKYCTECQGEYATRTCGTCLDKFCEGCWARIHRKGARRFHNWEPFTTASYSVSVQGATDAAAAAATDVVGATSGYYGYFPGWDGQNDEWAEGQQQQLSYEASWEQGQAGQGGGGELWPGGQANPANNAYPEYENYDNWQQAGPSTVADRDAYGGAVIFDGHAAATATATASMAGAVTEWTPSADANSGAYYYAGAAESAAATPQGEGWSGTTPETTGYYEGYGGAESFEAATDGPSEWAGWTTPETGNGASMSVVSGVSGGGDEYAWGDTKGAGGGVSGGGTGESSSGRPWSVNEYGQRVCGDWVEFWDESAQAGYFYNTDTGEASWTEPATG